MLFFKDAFNMHGPFSYYVYSMQKFIKHGFLNRRTQCFINAWFLSNSSENKQNLMSNKFLFFLSNFSQFEEILYSVATRLSQTFF